MPPATEKVKAIFLAALDRPSPTERIAFLHEACADDASLRQGVEALLRAQGRPDPLLDRPAAEHLDPEGTEAPDVASEQPGMTIAGRYQLLEPIGEGGMGTVWVAEQTQPVRRKVALKLIKAGMDSRQVLDRFRAERQALALMDHPNIAKVHDGGATESGRPFFVMEYVQGVPITTYCDDARLSIAERLELFVPVCQAVQHAHQKGVIHRDLKPANILVCPYDGRPVPKVIDFGLAKAVQQPLLDNTLYTGHGLILGTPLYMSPEQAEVNNLDVDTRTDVYALGVILYELLTGTTPLESRRLKEASWLEVLRLLKEEETPRPSARLSGSATLPSVAARRRLEPVKLTRLVRGELDWVVMKALEKDRNRRYETANGFALDLQRYLAGEPVQAAPPSRTYRLRKFVRKHRAAFLTGTALLLLLLAGVAVSTWQAVRATDAEGEARLAQQKEAARAEGETQAKRKAVEAAEAARRAHAEAQRRLAQVEKGNDVLLSIFADLNVRKVKEGTEPLEAVLAGRLVKAARQLEGEAVGDPLMVASLQDRLGLTLLNLGHPRQAIPLFVKAQRTRQAKQGPYHSDTLMTMNNLATGYQEAGKLELALPLYEQTLKLRKARLGADHRDTLMSMHNLAAGYQTAGKLGLALPLLEETFRLVKARLGADHPETHTSMNNLAVCYLEAGKPDRALPLLEEALKLRKVSLGPNHRDTLQSMGNLAMGYAAAGRLGEALPLFEETLKLARATLGADHPDTLTSMNNLARGYQTAGKLELALPLYEQTLELRKARQGADYPDTLASMHNLATAYQTAGKRELALPLFEQTVELRKARLGADHPRTLLSMSSLAVCYWAAGKRDLALPLFREAATGMEKRRFQLPHAGPLVLNLISCSEQLGQFDQAEPWRRKWLAVVKAQSGADSVPYAGELANLGRNLLRQKKWGDAEAALRDCLAIRTRKQPDAWTTFNAQAWLGGALLGQKKYADAEPYLLQGYRGMKQRAAQIPAPARMVLSEAVQWLVALYEATGNQDEAARWRAELQKV